MAHNGIEYADTQLIAEAYDLLRHGVGTEPRRPRPPAFGGRDNAITVAGGCR
jgi:hypothetical protein